MSWQYQYQTPNSMPAPQQHLPYPSRAPPSIPQSNATNTSSTNALDFQHYLEGMSTSELNELMENEDKINNFIMDDAKLKQIKLDKEMLTASSRSLADANLNKEPTLTHLKENLTTQYDVMKKLYESYQTNQAKFASVSKGANLETLLAILQTSLAEKEEETGVLEKQFNETELSTDEFLKQYQQNRKQAHLSRIKVDKMKELIMEIRQNASASSVAANPTPAPRSSNQNVPYPMQQNTPQYPAYNSQARHHASPSYPPQPTGQVYGPSSWR